MDATAKIWDVRSSEGAVYAMDAHTACVWSAVFGWTSRTILTASHDMTAIVHDERLAHPRSTLRGHRGILWEAKFSPDEKWAITCSEDCDARVWNLSGDVLEPTCYVLRGDGRGSHSGPVTCAAFQSYNS